MSNVVPFIPPSDGNPGFEALIAALQHGHGDLLALGDPLERPLRGTTLYLANCSLDTRHGTFRAYIFQDIIGKHYILALAHGDICGAGPLHTRLHSSCVTSETLRGCDCDCVQQLDGAFKVIAEKGRGVLFYLMQEGRGVGFLGKARDRMLVQASGDSISTFEAYRAMGLRTDHRHYDNISDICHLLGITAPFVVLTNNPAKVDALRAQGLPVAGSEPLEFEPGPFNLAYLASKAVGGHSLLRPHATRVRRALPPEPVVPFRPHALPEAQRFIYSASYFLPMTPVDDNVLLTAAQFRQLYQDRDLAHHLGGPRPLVQGHQLLRGDRYFVKIHRENLEAARRAHPDDPAVALLTTPYWFRVHVYYDIVSSQEFVVLTHGNPGAADIPVVRIHSESLFNRFPLRTADNREKLTAAVNHIVAHGCGSLLLLHNDGRGAGFGAFATDAMMTETGQAASTDEAYRRLAVDYDRRDYDAAIVLLKHHLPSLKIQMVMNSPESLVKKPEYAEALNRHRIDVEKWIFIDEDCRG